MRVAILGAGVTGLTAGKLLQEWGGDTTIFEKKAISGGLATSRYIGPYLYEPCEGHVFNSKRKEIVDWVFTNVLPKERWKETKRNSQIYFKGKEIPYPFELALNKLDTDLAVDCIYNYLNARKGKEPTNFEEWIYWFFGDGIAENYMIPYNKKIWNFPLNEMGVDWMDGKMPLPSKKEIIRSILLNDHSEHYMAHSYFYYPYYGIQEMVDALATGQDIRYNVIVNKIKRSDGKWIINDDDVFDYIVSTIPLPDLSNCFELPSDVMSAIQNLKYNGMTTILCKCQPTTKTVLYLPDPQYKAHRISFISTLTPNACPEGEGSASIAIIGNETISERDIVGGNIIPQELGMKDVICTSYTKYAYAIFDKCCQDNIRRIETYFNQIPNFTLVGKFSTWNYHNMDLCMADAFSVVNQLKNQI